MRPSVVGEQREGAEEVPDVLWPAAPKALDVLKVLQNEKDAPQDRMDKSIFLAGELIQLSGKAKEREGMKIAREFLESGKALKKFEAIRTLQGKRDGLALASNYFDVHAEKGGIVWAFIIWGSQGQRSLQRRQRTKVREFTSSKKPVIKLRKGEPLFRIYANNPTTLSFAREYSEKKKIYEIS